MVLIFKEFMSSVQCMTIKCGSIFACIQLVPVKKTGMTKAMKGKKANDVLYKGNCNASKLKKTAVHPPKLDHQVDLTHSKKKQSMANNEKPAVLKKKRTLLFNFSFSTNSSF